MDSTNPPGLGAAGAEPYRDATRVVRAGIPDAVPGQPFLPGPVFAAPYHLPVDGQRQHLDSYGRPDNPTRRLLERAIAELEGGECLTFSSGMAAISALLLAMTRPGDTVVLPADGYYAVRRLAAEVLEPIGVRVLLAPTVGPYPSLRGVRLVLLETPANPTLDVADISTLAAAAHAGGALLAVDNTAATPLGQQPLRWGADFSVASGTKALTGHSDLLLGYLCATDPAALAPVRGWRDQTGAVPGAFDAWLAHRSLGTLDLRLGRQSSNAQAIATVLSGRSDVERVRWPGLPGDPAYPMVGRQLRRVPGIVAFELASAARVARFLAASRLVLAATSFGGLHTSADRRAQWGDQVPEGFVRLSCGVEDPIDLVADITAALDAAG